jgi:hypothetical protein
MKRALQSIVQKIFNYSQYQSTVKIWIQLADIWGSYKQIPIFTAFLPLFQPALEPHKEILELDFYERFFSHISSFHPAGFQKFQL